MTIFKNNEHQGAIYLSGGMQHAEELGEVWRLSCSKWMKEAGFVPIDITQLDVAYASAHGDMYRALENEEDMCERKSNIRRHYIHADLKLIEDHTDAVVVYYDHSVRKGAGTISECQVAYNLGLPVFLVNAYSNIHEVPGWLQGLSTKMFDSFDALKEYMESLPPGILRRDVYGNYRSQSHYLCSLCGSVFPKHKTHFVSKVFPLYCPTCVDVVKDTHEAHPDRYEYFINILKSQE